MSSNDYNDLIISEIIKKNLEHNNYERKQIQLEIPQYDNVQYENKSRKELKEPKRVIIIDI